MINSTADREAVSSRPRRGKARDPILQSKITVPDLASWVEPRPRLVRRIAQGARGPLTSVTGPPGAGKTLAIASWAAAHEAGTAGHAGHAGSGGHAGHAGHAGSGGHAGPAGPVGWVTLDGFDNSPEVFWSYVVAALRQAGVAVTRAAAALARGEIAGHVFLLQVASALAGHQPEVTLVLDDFHLITDESVLDGLAYVLKNARPGLRLVVASRIDPALPLHQYRLTGDLTEIRAGELAFTVPEAASLMVQHGVDLPAASLEFLTERDEGWAAGLRMAAMSMAGHPDPEQFVKNLVAEDSAIAGYLVEEVLNTQPDDVRDLLLYTSILDQVNAGIAAVLLGRDQAASTLESLARGNSFVRPVGDGWYRYHSLFRGVLRLKLRAEQPEIVAGLHRAAARWYQRSGPLAEAVRYAAKAGDWGLAASILVDELAIGELTGPGSGGLPVEGFRGAPVGDVPPRFLLAAAAVALSESGTDAAGPSLVTAEEKLGRLPEDGEACAWFAAATIRCAVALRRGDVAALDAATAAAERLLHKVPQAMLVRRPQAVAQVLSWRGAVELWSGHPGNAAGTFARANRLLEDVVHGLEPGHPEMPARRGELAACRGHLALAEALRGRLNSAAEIADERTVVPGDGPAGQPDPVSALALALVCLERGEQKASRARLKAADKALRARPDRLASAVGYLVAARGSLVEGRIGAVLDTIERARGGWSPPPLLEHMLALTESQAHAASGDGPAALDAARRVEPQSGPDARVALSRAWLAAGDVGEARRTLATVLQAPADEAPEPARLAAWLADALLSFRGGDEARGRRSLAQALKLGEGERRRLPFAVERTWMRPALARHPELADAHRQLLGPGLVAPGSVPARRDPGATAPPVVVEPLSAREKDVLRHVGEMLDTADIAAEMYISVNTVKTHLKSIFRKLGAADRRAAVRRARQLDLLLPARRALRASPGGQRRMPHSRARSIASSRVLAPSLR